MWSCSFHANPASLLQGHFHWFPWLRTVTTLLQHWRESITLRETPTSLFWCIQADNLFLLTKSPWKMNPGSMLFLSYFFFFFKDVCIDFYQCQCHSAHNTRNDNLILFVFLFNVSWALTEKRWRKDYQALSTNKVNCFIEIKLSKTLWQSKVTKKIHE